MEGDGYRIIFASVDKTEVWGCLPVTEGATGRGRKQVGDDQSSKKRGWTRDLILFGEALVFLLWFFLLLFYYCFLFLRSMPYSKQ